MAIRNLFGLFLLPRSNARRARAFCADKRGTTAIEFAMIAVPFLGLIGAIFELGFAHFRTAQLQTTVENASRILLTNKPILEQGASEITHREFVRKYICTWKSNGGTVEPGTLGTMFDCDDVFLQLSVVNAFNRTQVGQNRIVGQNLPIPRLPGPGEIVVLKLFYRYRMMMSVLALDGTGGIVKITPPTRFAINGRIYDNEVYMLSAYAAFRVEPAG